MNWLRYVLVLLLGAVGLLGSLEGRAVTICDADMTDLKFNLADPSDRTATATIRYTCATGFANGDKTTLRMCFSIGAGTPPSSISNRRMTNSFSETLSFEIYQNDNQTRPWRQDPDHHELEISYPLYSGFNIFSGSIPVYGYIPDLAGIAPGNYSNYFADGRLVFQYNDGPGANDPVACDGGRGSAGNPSSFTFTALATVPGSCTVLTASDTKMDFGTLYSTSTGNLTSTIGISLECTRRTAWRVGLNDGVNTAAADGSRQLCTPDDTCVRYQLNRPASYGGGRWGNTGTETVDGTSSGVPQTLIVDGVISDQPLTRAGLYTDTVTVTLTY